MKENYNIIQGLEYGSDTIVTLDWKGHIRRRLGMYIGKTGDGSHADDGIYVLIKEILNNSIVLCMKIILVVVFWGLAFSAFPKETLPPVRTVKGVDLERYQGLWYEIASFPQWFERGMSHVTAQYILLPDGTMSVVNSGIKDGKRKTTKGKAWAVPNTGNAKLKVRFFWPFAGDYWVIALDPDYQWAVVSNANRSTLWVLARSPQISTTLYSDLLLQLEQDHYEITRIRFMKQ